MMKLAAFDLDGTLTQHKSKLTERCRETLVELSRRYPLVMVCAGSCQRVYEQMGQFPIDIIGCYGMERSSVHNGTFQMVNRTRTEQDRHAAIQKMERIRMEYGFLDYDGESVEFHGSGVITLPLLGTGAPLEKKLAFDPDRRKRRACYDRVRGIFPQYNVFIGGSSSFDIVPKPFQKRYALEQYVQRMGVSPEDVVYFGDDYGLGGNDSDLFHSDVHFIPIDCYEDFPGIAKDVLL